MFERSSSCSEASSSSGWCHQQQRGDASPSGSAAAHAHGLPAMGAASPASTSQQPASMHPEDIDAALQVLEELVGGMDDSPLQADELPLAALLGGSSSAAAGAEGFGDLACPMSPLHCAWECFLGESHEHQPITAAKEQQGLEQLKGPHGWSSGAVAGLKSRRPSCMSDASNAGLSSPWASVPLPSPAGPSTADGPGEAGSYCLESGGSSSFALPWDLFPQLSVGAAAAAEGQGQVCAAGPGAGLSTLADVDTAALCAMVDWTDLVDWVPSSGPQLTLFGEHPQQPRAGVTAPGQRKQSGSRSKKAGAAGGSASDRRRAGGAGAGVQGPAAVALMGEEGEADAEVVAAAAAAAAAAVVAAAEGAQDGASQGLASPASDKRKRQPSVRRKRWGEGQLHPDQALVDMALRGAAMYMDPVLPLLASMPSAGLAVPAPPKRRKLPAATAAPAALLGAASASSIAGLPPLSAMDHAMVAAGMQAASSPAVNAAKPSSSRPSPRPPPPTSKPPPPGGIVAGLLAEAQAFKGRAAQAQPSGPVGLAQLLRR